MGKSSQYKMKAQRYASQAYFSALQNSFCLKEKSKNS